MLLSELEKIKSNNKNQKAQYSTITTERTPQGIKIIRTVFETKEKMQEFLKKLEQ